MIRRIVVDNSDDKVNVVNKGDNLVITADDGGQQNKRGAGVGNRSSLFNEVHVQWKKSGKIRRYINETVLFNTICSPTNVVAAFVN